MKTISHKIGDTVKLIGSDITGILVAKGFIAGNFMYTVAVGDDKYNVQDVAKVEVQETTEVQETVDSVAEPKITLKKSITSELVCAGTFGYTLHQSNFISDYVRPCYQECHHIQYGNTAYDMILQNGMSFFHSDFSLPDYRMEVYSITCNNECIYLDDIELSHPDLYEYIQGLCHDATNKLDIEVDSYEYLMFKQDEHCHSEELSVSYDEVDKLELKGYICIECFPK